VTLLNRQQNPIFLSSSVGYGLMLSFYVTGLYHSVQSFLFYLFIIISLENKLLEPICMLLLMLEGLKRRGAYRSGPISFVSIGPHLQKVMTVTNRSKRAFFLGTFHILTIVCGEKKVTLCTKYNLGYFFLKNYFLNFHVFIYY
jgi:hypothetical protein